MIRPMPQGRAPGRTFRTGRLLRLVSVLCALAAWAAQVPVAPPAFAGIPLEDQLDCRFVESKDRFGRPVLSVGPFDFVRGSVIARVVPGVADWERAVGLVLNRYREACRRYNAGLTPQDEFDEQVLEVGDLHGEALQITDRAVKLASGGATAERAALGAAVRAWVAKVDAMAPLPALRGRLPPEAVQPGPTTGTAGAAPLRPERTP